MELFAFDKSKLQKMINHIQKIINKYSIKGVSIEVKKDVLKTHNYNSKGDNNILEEPLESDDTYEISFRYNNNTFNRRFLYDNIIGQIKAFVRSKIDISNIR